MSTVSVGDIIKFSTGVSAAVRDIYTDGEGREVAKVIWSGGSAGGNGHGEEDMSEVESWFDDGKIEASLSDKKLRL